jgi:hypothetical protein
VTKPPSDDPKQKDPKKASLANELDRAAPQPVEPTVVVSDEPPKRVEHPHAHLGGDPMPEAAPPDATEIGSVDELYGAINPPPAHEHIKKDPVDEPLLPATTDANALRDAVGLAPEKHRKRAKEERDEDEPPPAKRKRKLFTVAALSMLGVLVITTFALLGHANSARFAITCTTDHIAAEQGRSFPPWGTRPMRGAEWKPIPLPPNAECTPRETENRSDLEGWYLDLLVERASTTLTTPNLLDGVATPMGGAKGGPNVLDTVTAQLDQALLLSRSPERRDQRKEVERLQGDVQYWRASLRLRDASAALVDASRQFDAAAQQRPRHVTDAAAWGAYVKKLADDLKAGPNGVPAAPTPAIPGTIVEHPSAPMGTALPVEAPPPTAGSDAPPPATPDAGVPTGGVLL